MGVTGGYPSSDRPASDLAPPPTGPAPGARTGGAPRQFLGPDLHAQLQQAADERGVTVTWLGRQLMREALADLLPPDEFRLTRQRPKPPLPAVERERRRRVD